MDDQLVRDLYAAVVQPDELPAILARLSSRFDADSSFMFSSHSDVQPEAVLIGHRLDLNDIQAFAAHWNEEDPWALAASQRGLMKRNVVVVGEELVPNSDLRRTRFFNEFGQRAGMGRMLGSVLFDGREEVAPLPFTNLCWYRESNKDAFSSKDREALRALLPHLQNGFAMRHKLQEMGQHAASERQLETHLLVTSFRLDGSGRILGSHTEESAAVKAAQLRISAGRVRAVGNRCSPTFDEALKSVRTTGRPERIVGQTMEGSLFRATLALLPPDRLTFCGMARQPELLLIVEFPLQYNDELMRRAASLFALSQAERVVLAGLLQGKTVLDIASEQSISPYTVRTQVRNVLAKSGFKRQVDLVRALSRLTG